MSRRRARTANEPGQPGHQPDSRQRGRFRVLRDPHRAADPGQAHHVGQPLRHQVDGCLSDQAALLGVGDADHDDTFALPDPHLDPEVAHGAPDVVVQQPLELLAIAAFKHDLAKLEQHARLTELACGVGVSRVGYWQHGHHLSLPPRGSRCPSQAPGMIPQTSRFSPRCQSVPTSAKPADRSAATGTASRPAGEP